MIYLPKIDFDTFTHYDEKRDRWWDIFEKRGNFTNDFVSRTNLNVLNGRMWVCYGRRRFQETELYKGANYDSENEVTRIRLSETYPFKWDPEDKNEEGLLKYMKRPWLEKSYKLKLSKQDLLNPELLRGFYLGEYGCFYAILDVKNVLFHYETKMEKNFPKEWERFRLKFLLR